MQFNFISCILTVTRDLADLTALHCILIISANFHLVLLLCTLLLGFLQLSDQRTGLDLADGIV